MTRRGSVDLGKSLYRLAQKKAAQARISRLAEAMLREKLKVNLRSPIERPRVKRSVATYLSSAVSDFFPMAR